jgi:hypothetical protein
MRFGHARVYFDSLARQAFCLAMAPGLKMENSERIESLGLARIYAQDFSVETCRFREIARLMRPLGVLKEKIVHREELSPELPVLEGLKRSPRA